MSFFYNILKKDIIFLKNLSNRNKKLIIYFFFFFLFFIIFYVKKERFIFFLILLLFLLIWKSFIELLLYVIINNNVLKNFIRNHDSKFTYIINFLLFVQKWKNPFLILLLYMDKFILKVIRNLIYNFKIKYNYDLTDNQLFKVFFFYYFIINIIAGPLKLFFGFIYTIIYRMIELPFSFFLIIRMIGFTLSILIFSDLFKMLYNILGFYNLFFIIYFLLVFINCIIKYISRDFIFLKTQYINNFIKTDYLIYLRNHSTVIGILILGIDWYKSTLISREYMDITSSYLKIELEEGFYKYWEYYKRNTWLNTTNVWKEIKNRPSFYLYLNLITWLNVSPVNTQYAPCAIINIIYIKLKIEFLKIILPEKLLKDLDYLYNFFLLRLKLLLFMIWDIDNYIGNDTWNYIICEYDERLKIFNIKSDFNLFDFLDRNNFKVEKNKEDLPFYDLEVNIEFFDRLYMLIGIIPYNEDPLELTVFSDILIKIKNTIEMLNSKLSSSYNIASWNRTWHYYITEYEEYEMLLIENRIKDWIINFLYEQHKEWEILLLKENIEERNWRLLKEIEQILLKK